jgi:hypothetical protein
VSSEAGFLLQGSFPVGCVRTRMGEVQTGILQSVSGMGSDFMCERRSACITTYVLWKNTGGKCLLPALGDRLELPEHNSDVDIYLGGAALQTLLAGKASEWAGRVVGLYDGAEFVVNYMSRYSVSVFVEGKPLRLPVCPFRPAGKQLWRVVNSSGETDDACVNDVGMLGKAASSPAHCQSGSRGSGGQCETCDDAYTADADDVDTAMHVDDLACFH